MKICTCCDRTLDIEKFSPQKTNPSKLYAYCDQCRFDVNSARLKQSRKQVALDYDKLRSKAKELRKLNHEQALEIHARRRKGETLTALASEFKVSTSTIAKASRSPKIYE